MGQPISQAIVVLIYALAFGVVIWAGMGLVKILQIIATTSAVIAQELDLLRQGFFQQVITSNYDPRITVPTADGKRPAPPKPREGEFYGYSDAIAAENERMAKEKETKEREQGGLTDEELEAHFRETGATL